MADKNSFSVIRPVLSSPESFRGEFNSLAAKTRKIRKKEAAAEPFFRHGGKGWGGSRRGKTRRAFNHSPEPRKLFPRKLSGFGGTAFGVQNTETPQRKNAIPSMRS